MSGSAFPLLFSPLQVGTLSVRNRVVCAAHLTGFAEDGLPTEAQIAYYEEKARGGAGLIVFESTPVHASGASFTHAIHPYDPRAQRGLRRIAEAVHRSGSVVLGQLWHSGRQGSSAVTGMPLWAPSAIACPVNREVPKAMTSSQIEEVIQAFGVAAHEFQAAGFDGVEVAAGHGYLVHQFLSPLSNLRTDGYGGSTEKRSRFLMELLDRIRAACGRAFVLGIRLSADEFLPGGFGLDDSLRLVRQLVERRDVDFLSVSAGTHATVEPMVGDWSIPRGNLVHLARAVRDVAGGVPVIACGRIVDPEQAEAILHQGDADLIGAARALIADPHWAAKAASARRRTVRPCIACNDCEARLFRGLPIACVVNPTLSEDGDAVPRTPRPKNVVVVGGGPAGMEAARIAALRGHSVRLYEQGASLGGQLRLVEALGTREEFARITAFLEAELERLDVDVRVGSPARVEDVVAAAADAVIVATGSVSEPPAPIPGDLPRALMPEELAAGTEGLGRRVLVVDCGTAHDRLLAVAEAVLAEGRQVDLVTPEPRFGSDLSFISLAGILRRLKAGGARLSCSTVIRRIEAGVVELQNVPAGPTRRLHGVETAVMLARNRSQSSLLEELDGKFSQLLAVGDCVAPRGLEQAFREGRLAALKV